VKAFLLAAGVGSRLRPHTDSRPKCMIEIDGRPMLDIWLDAFAAAGVDEVLLNLHHLPEVVERHLAQRTGGPQVHVVFEPELLGSAGTLRANRGFVESEDAFFVCYADNLTDFDLGSLVSFHAGHGADASLTVFHTATPSACGIVALDGAGLVTGFCEKPAHPRSDLANAGISIYSPSVLDLIAGPDPRDIGFDVMPALVGRSRAMLIEGYFRDIGTPESLEQARAEWPVVEHARRTARKGA
jgi:mannose-1-phosphate guanylyltransferase